MTVEVCLLAAGRTIAAILSIDMMDKTLLVFWMLSLEYRFKLVTQEQRSCYRTSSRFDALYPLYEALRSSDIDMPNTSVSTAELVPYTV
jgi:hypothetical protein